MSNGAISKIETNNAELARAVAAEGFVLLKNDNILPIAKGKIALYGTGVRHTVKGGTGSGEVNNRKTITIEQGLLNAGYTVTTKHWLDDCDFAFRAGQKERKKRIRATAKDISAFDWGKLFNNLSEIHEAFPVGRAITQKDVDDSDTDTAIYVIARQAGEGKDRAVIEEDYLLTKLEKENLRFLCKNYKKTILVINSGASIDCSVLDDINIGAVVYFAQGGQEGGNALADVLSGKINFSGKLSASWAKDIHDLKITDTYSGLDGNIDYEEYIDGVYVGYRFYDSFNVEPRFPFGYGLSYTNFSIKSSIRLQNADVCVDVEVQNTGKVTGKEVVQVYVSFPNGEVKREYQSLVAFGKTPELKAGETCKFQLSFALKELAYYDEKTASYILANGDYIIRIGNSSRNTKAQIKLRVKESVITEVCKNVCQVNSSFEEIAPSYFHRNDDLPILEVDAATIVVQHHEYKKPECKDITPKLTSEECVTFTVGGSTLDRRDMEISPGSCGVTNRAISQKYKINRIVMADGPAGLRLIPEYRSNGKRIKTKNGIPEVLRIAKWIYRPANFFMGLSSMPKKTQYCTAFPVAILQAQTFNTALIEQVGVAVAEEMKQFGINVWLAPGMNIQKHPLCGRNFEYYSEDPILTGYMAAALTRGVQSKNGCAVTIKHFCCNNQENNRMKSDSRVHERALRELYLKGFRIAVETAKPKCVMTSYNKLNGVYTNSRYDLCTEILRCEWAFDGFVMTDWDDVAEGQAVAHEAIAAGSDIIMPGGDKICSALNNAIKSNQLSEEKVKLSASRIIAVAQSLSK